MVADVTPQNVKVDWNLVSVEEWTNIYYNESYKKSCKSVSHGYNEYYIKVHLLTHQYWYNKYSISVNDLRKSKFDRHKNKRKKVCRLSQINKEHKLTKSLRKLEDDLLIKQKHCGT